MLLYCLPRFFRSLVAIFSVTEFVFS